MFLNRTAILVFALITLAYISGYAQQPKLILVVSYDQLRADRLNAFYEDFCDGGFRRLVKEGCSFDSCMFGHANNMTAPGHSIMLSGCYPYKNGIVANEFVSRELSKSVGATFDTAFGRSPRALMVPTLGDVLKAKSKESRVIGISIKDRAAILMTGQKADYALWLDASAGGLGTSRYYKSPQWLKDFNDDKIPKKAAGTKWKALVPPPPPSAFEEHPQQFANRKPGEAMPEPVRYTASQMISKMDFAPWEGDFPGGSKVFPHQIPPYTNDKFWWAFVQTPASIEWLFEAARRCIEEEKLGMQSQTDVLCISVSTTDEVGHLFGPDSREMKEILISSDRILAEFIDYLDSKIGRDKYVLVVTGDHGVTDIPEDPRVQRDGQSGRTTKSQIMSAIDKGFFVMPNPMAENTSDVASSGQIVRFFEPPYLFIDSSAAAKFHLDYNTLCDSVCSLLRALPGIGYALPTSDLISSRKPASVDSVSFALMRADIYPSRVGDVAFYPKKYWILGEKITTHGAPYEYDRHVPLIFFGSQVKAARDTQSEVSPADIAPTLSKILGVEMKNVDGKALPVWLND